MAKHKKGARLTAAEIGEVRERLKWQEVPRISRETGISQSMIYSIKREYVPRLRIRSETVSNWTDGRNVFRCATQEVAADSKVKAFGSAWGEIDSRDLVVPLHWAGTAITPEETNAPSVTFYPSKPAARLDIAFTFPPRDLEGIVVSDTGMNFSGQILESSGFTIHTPDPSSEVQGCWLAQPVALYNPHPGLAAYLPPGKYDLRVIVECDDGEGDERYYTLVSPDSWEGLELKLRQFGIIRR